MPTSHSTHGERRACLQRVSSKLLPLRAQPHARHASLLKLPTLSLHGRSKDPLLTTWDSMSTPDVQQILHNDYKREWASRRQRYREVLEEQSLRRTHAHLESEASIAPPSPPSEPSDISIVLFPKWHRSIFTSAPSLAASPPGPEYPVLASNRQSTTSTEQPSTDIPAVAVRQRSGYTGRSSASDSTKTYHAR